MKRVLRISSVVALLAAFAAGCGGGGGGSAAPAAVPPPTDARTNTTSISQQSVHAVASVVAPSAAAAPKSIGRVAGRSSRRTLHTVTDTIGNIQGRVGDTFTITYTNEPSDGCTINGTLNGAVTAISGIVVSVSISGTLAYTQCTDSPNMTTTITNGTMSVMDTSMTTSFPMHFAFTGKSYTLDITYATAASDYNGKTYLNSETYKGRDSLGNTFDFGNGYNALGQALSSYNKNNTDGTANNITGQFYPADHIVRYTGTSTLSNNIVIDYRLNDAGAFWLHYTEVKDTSSDTISYDVTLMDGAIGFTTNTGYTGSYTWNADGSGSGTVKDASAATVASLTWSAAGMCSVDYTDAAITDEQFYNTNIDEALAG